MCRGGHDEEGGDVLLTRSDVPKLLQDDASNRIAKTLPYAGKDSQCKSV